MLHFFSRSNCGEVAGVAFGALLGARLLESPLPLESRDSSAIRSKSDKLEVLPDSFPLEVPRLVLSSEDVPVAFSSFFGALLSFLRLGFFEPDFEAAAALGFAGALA